MDLLENIHPHPLAGDKPMPELRVIRQAALERYTSAGKHLLELLLQPGLGRPGGPIAMLAQVAARDQDRLVLLKRLHFNWQA
jgi:hypothetical protein